MKNAVVAIQRLEGKYLQEWVGHYLSLGFDLVIICDNNQLSDNEDVTEILSDYIKDKKVIIDDSLCYCFTLCIQVLLECTYS